MIKFFLRFLFLILIILTATIFFLSYFGLETDKFDSLIKNKANTVNQNVKLEFNKTKIYLDIIELKILIKLKKPSVLLRENEIKLTKLNLFLSILSFYNSDFLLEKAEIGFNNNNIKDLTKITNIFVPKIINKKINKMFKKGSLNGEFIIPFNSDGSISENYKFFGKVIEADINLNKNYILKNFTADIGFGKNSEWPNSTDLLNGIGLRNIKGAFMNLTFGDSSGSDLVDIHFGKDSKTIILSLNTFGNIDFNQLKKIASTFNYKIDFLEDVNLTLGNKNKTKSIKIFVKFDLKNSFKISNLNYKAEGHLSKAKIEIKNKKSIKDFLPLFHNKIFFKNSNIIFTSNNKSENKQNFQLNGSVKFGNKFENIEISQQYESKSKIYSVKASSTLNSSEVNIDSLNYKKPKNKNAKIIFNTNFMLNNYFFIDYLNYSDSESKINLQKIKFNNKLEIDSLNSLKVKTSLNNLKNNDFSVNKKDILIIKGKVFDAQSLLKSLFKKNSKKTFSKKFSMDLKINFDKAITGTNDDVSNLGIIASINKGAYDKLSLKGNFSEKEIIEMSIYQVDKDTKTLQVISDRARPFIKHFNFIEGFEGGKLQYESTTINKKSDSVLIITDFKVAKVPALAKLLTLASLQGIADTLSGEGIRFTSFDMKSSTKDNVMNIEDALAIGPAVSILLDGYVDKGKVVSLRGTLVPATKLNSIIASIPVVGNILVGKKTGEGIVGVSFKMKGPPKKIKTTVNPIKTLTPRFIVRTVEKLKNKKEDQAK
jgi:hypothetical protein